MQTLCLCLDYIDQEIVRVYTGNMYTYVNYYAKVLHARNREHMCTSTYTYVQLLDVLLLRSRQPLGVYFMPHTTFGLNARTRNRDDNTHKR